MLEFVDSGLYFVQDKNNFINIVTGRIRRAKINGSDRIRILVPGLNHDKTILEGCQCKVFLL